MQTVLLKKEAVAEGTLRFHFAKPEGFTYQAGQSIDLFLINPPETDAEGNKRAFSLTSAPHQPDLMITTRMRDTAFKRVLGNMEPGGIVTIEGPFGSFLLHENNSRPAIFLAGGIGVTPFRSMVLDATTRALPHRIVLFYSNRRPEDAPFLTELKEIEKQNKNFSLVATMTNMEKSSEQWEGERGYVDTAMLARHVPEGTQPIYYLAGPQGMVLALRDVLKASEVSQDDIRYEEFAGY
jgi:ferredoxin-NADP reductase